MEEAISFFRAFEFWIYAILGIGGLVYIRKFILAWQELHVAAFGLERDSAQARLNQSASMLVFILILAVMEFTLVTFIAPSMPGVSQLPTSTIDLLASPTTTLPLETAQSTVDTSPSSVITSTSSESGCLVGQIMISSPENDNIVSGVVEVSGTANIPNFGFYKLEIKRPADTIWATIQAGNHVTINGKLGDWDTRNLTPGVYQLGLVVVDNEAKASQPCVVQVSVTTPPQETASP